MDLAIKATRLRWSLVVVLLPLLGWILWARLAPRGLAYAPSSPEGQKK